MWALSEGNQFRMKVRCWALKTRQTQPCSLRAAMAIRALPFWLTFLFKGTFLLFIFRCAFFHCKNSWQTHIFQGWNIRAGPRHRHCYCTSHFLFVLTQPPAQTPSAVTPRLQQQQQIKSTFKQQKHQQCKQPELGLIFSEVRNSVPFIPFRDFTSPGRGDLTEPSTTRFKHFFFFFATSLTIRFLRAEVKPKHEAESWVGMATGCDPNPALHLLSPCSGALWQRHLIHSFSAAKIFQRCTNTKKFLMSYPQPSSAGNEVIHAVRIWISHGQKTSQDRGKKSHVLLKPGFRVINHNSFISYRTTSWLLFLRVVFKELWKNL